MRISDLEDLQTLSDLTLQERLQKEWETDPGPCASILGILTVAHSSIMEDFNLQPLRLERISKVSVEWLTKLWDEKRPYILSLTLKGLQVLDERLAFEIVQNTLQTQSAVEETLELLQEAMEQAVTPRSKVVLGEAMRLMERLIKRMDSYGIMRATRGL